MEPNPGDETPQGERRGRFGGTVPPGRVEQIVTTWPAELQALARHHIAQYGPPQEFSASRLVWFLPDGRRTLVSGGAAR